MEKIDAEAEQTAAYERLMGSDSSSPDTPETLEQAVFRLSKLPELQYESVRESEAKKLNCRVSKLDDFVKNEKGDQANEPLSPVEKTRPYSEQVSGSDLLDEIEVTLKKHVYLPDGTATALSLWCLGTFCMSAWKLWAKCLITSPEKRCGKTVLVETMEALTCKALVASNISPAAVFRVIEKLTPTLFLDETDTFLKDNPELNGVLNAGHRRRTAKIIRSEKIGEAWEPVAFDAFGAQVIAGIGSQRDTLHDRSIHVEMERKLPDERIEKLPVDFFEQHKTLREKCLRWANDNVQKLKHLEASLPNYGNDRAQDNWLPLIKVATLAGEEWPEKALASYKILTLKTDVLEDAGLLLLRDIKAIFERKERIKLASAELVASLITFEDSPWFEWKRGKPLSQNSLSRLLRPFKIKPATIRIQQQTKKGYQLSDFKNAFSRYIPTEKDTHAPYPPNQSVTPSQTSPDAGCSGNQTVTQKKDVTLLNPRKSPPDAECYGVTLEKGGYGAGVPLSRFLEPETGEEIDL